MFMKAFKSLLIGGAVLAAALVSAPKAAAQAEAIHIGSNIDYNIGLGFGVNFTSGISEDDYYAPMRKAWGFDFSFNFAEFYWSGLSRDNQFYLTLGLENKSFRMRDRYAFDKDTVLGTNELLMVDYLDPDDLKMSAFRVFSWNVGMGYRHIFDDDVDIMIGPIVNFNTGSRIKTKYYDLNDKLQKAKTKFGHQELVTIELMARVNISGIGLYLKYNPFPLIEKNYGPEFTTWSFGIML